MLRAISFLDKFGTQVLADDENLKVFTTRVFVSFLIAFTDISQHEPSPRREIDHYFFTLLSTREMYSTV